MQRLNKALARKKRGAQEVDAVRTAPVRVLQVGTGNFLRAFCGWMFEQVNGAGLFRGSIAVAQATPGSTTTRQFREQDGCYTVLTRGLQEGNLVEEQKLITGVTQVLNPYEEWSEYLALAASPDLRFVVSNTTEAGIIYKAVDRFGRQCPDTFPAQMTALLLQRFKHFSGAPDAGLVFLPCELIERNGTQLRDIILRHATELQLGGAFAEWVHDASTFCNTLVDRIVTGYPKEEASAIQQQLGYADELLVASELYHNWIIEGPSELARELPFTKAGLNVTWTDDVTPYRTRKVRILNGAHTTLVAAAFLAGCDTVLAGMNDPLICSFVEQALADEIGPYLPVPDDAARFSKDVLNRFRNPTIQHRLLSIALNSTSKWKVRVLPSLLQFVQSTGRVPHRLAFSLAALIALYRVKVNEVGVGVGSRNGQPYELTDTPEALRLLSEAWKTYDDRNDAVRLSHNVLGQRGLWDSDLNEIPGLTNKVAVDLEIILTKGMRAAIAQVTSKL